MELWWNYVKFHHNSTHNSTPSKPLIIKAVTVLRWKSGIRNHKKYFSGKRVEKVLTTVKIRTKQGLHHDRFLVNTLKKRKPNTNVHHLFIAEQKWSAPIHRAWAAARKNHLFPLARLCVLQSIWQLLSSVAPPLLHAITWSASISFNAQILSLLASCPIAQRGQLLACFSLASVV